MSFGHAPFVIEDILVSSAICVEECHFAVLNRASSNIINGKKVALSKIFNTSKGELTRKKLEKKVDELMEFSIFRGGESKILFPFVYSFVLEEIPYHRVILKEGEMSDYIYFLVSGKYKTLTTVNLPLEDEFGLSLSNSPIAKKFISKTVDVNTFS